MGLTFSPGPTIGRKCPCNTAPGFIIFISLGTQTTEPLFFSLSHSTFPEEVMVSEIQNHKTETWLSGATSGNI